MAVPSLSSIVAIGVDILNAIRDKATKTVLFQTGDVFTGQVESDRVESWQHVGFVSLPSKPVAKKAACQAIVWKRGDIDVCTNTRDLRGQAIAGTLTYGETCVYASGPDGAAQGRILLKANGSVNVYTTKDNADGGTGMGLFVNPDGSITLASHNGAAVTIGADGSAKVFNAKGAAQVMPDGTVKLSSNVKVVVSGPAIVLGGAATMPVATLPDVSQLLALIAALQTQAVAMQAHQAAIGAAPVTATGAAIAALPTFAASTAAVAATTALIAAGSAALPATMMLKRVSAD